MFRAAASQRAGDERVGQHGLVAGERRGSEGGGGGGHSQRGEGRRGGRGRCAGAARRSGPADLGWRLRDVAGGSAARRMPGRLDARTTSAASMCHERVRLGPRLRLRTRAGGGPSTHANGAARRRRRWRRSTRPGDSTRASSSAATRSITPAATNRLVFVADAEAPRTRRRPRPPDRATPRYPPAGPAGRRASRT